MSADLLLGKMMKYITLKNNDKLCKLGMGSWFIGDNPNRRKDEIAAFRLGIENGVNLIDTAEMYGNGRSEHLIGEAIRPYARSSLYIVSKVLPNNANANNMERACDNSLKNLGTDYLDMYLYHWRGATPLDETIKELEHLKKKAKFVPGVYQILIWKT